MLRRWRTMEQQMALPQPEDLEHDAAQGMGEEGEVKMEKGIGKHDERKKK